MNIGHDVRGLIREAKLEKGLVTVACRLSGGLIAILAVDGKGQEMRDRLKKDLADHAEDSMKALWNPTLSIPVENGKMYFEPWQDLFLVDYEPSGRRREVLVQLFPEASESAKGGKK